MFLFGFYCIYKACRGFSKMVRVKLLSTNEGFWGKFELIWARVRLIWLSNWARDSHKRIMASGYLPNKTHRLERIDWSVFSGITRNWSDGTLWPVFRLTSPFSLLGLWWNIIIIIITLNPICACASSPAIIFPFMHILILKLFLRKEKKKHSHLALMPSLRGHLIDEITFLTNGNQ